MIHKYDIYQANLYPKRGSVQTGVRPVLVVQGNIFNASDINTTIVLPLTSNIAKVFPSEFVVTPSKMNGLQLTSKVMGLQIMVLDKSCLIKKLGTLEEKYIPSVIRCIDIALDRNDLFLDDYE